VLPSARITSKPEVNFCNQAFAQACAFYSSFPPSMRDMTIYPQLPV